MTIGDDIKDEPFFEERVGARAPQNVSALIGKTAFLTCVVRNLGKAKSVSAVAISIFFYIGFGKRGHEENEKFYWELFFSNMYCVIRNLRCITQLKVSLEI
jgi:hypothetical protein